MIQFANLPNPLNSYSCLRRYCSCGSENARGLAQQLVYPSLVAPVTNEVNPKGNATDDQCQKQAVYERKG